MTVELKLFQKLEDYQNERYLVHQYKSMYYDFNIINNLDFKWTNFEIKRNSLIEFLPQLYIKKDDNGICKIEVQTTSYGSLNLSDFDKFLKNQNEVLEYIREIQLIINNDLVDEINE